MGLFTASDRLRLAGGRPRPQPMDGFPLRGQEGSISEEQRSSLACYTVDASASASTVTPQLLGLQWCPCAAPKIVPLNSGGRVVDSSRCVGGN